MNLFSFFSSKTCSYMKKPVGPPPPSYTCFRCGKPGHYIKNCPTNGVRLGGAGGCSVFNFYLESYVTNVNTHSKNCVFWCEIQRLHGSVARSEALNIPIDLFCESLC